MLANLAAALLILPAWLVYRLAATVVGSERLFPSWSQAISLLPGLTGAFVRRAFYRWTLDHCGEGAHISFGTVLSHCTTQIGRNAYVGVFCTLGDVDLEDDVLVSSHVSIINGGHQHGTDRLDIPMRDQPGKYPRIRIGRDSWIGERAVVMADVGRHCIVGAGAVVTKPVPDFTVVAGVPAQVIERRGEQFRCNAAAIPFQRASAGPV